MDKKHKIVIAVAILVLMIAMYFWWKRRQDIPVATTIEESSSEIDTSLGKTKVFPLKLGSRNEEVKKLQSWLLKNEGSKIKIDGIWGSETDAAIKKFLKVNEISEDKFNSLKIG